MENSGGRDAGLELLPQEILLTLVDHLRTEDVKILSSVCRRLRTIYLSHIFRHVEFRFSRSGLRALRELLLSDLRQYIVSFTYTIPELLHPGNASQLHVGENS